MYKYVFVTLVYKTYNDLDEFLTSIKRNINENYKVLVVNAYFDDSTENKIKNVADKHFADFISVPNNGYSFGNNKGIEYSIDNYDFEFLIISNPDIIIGNFESSVLDKYKNKNVIIGPKIINLSGKNQNPLYYKFTNTMNNLFYISAKFNSIILRNFVIIYSKLINRISNKKNIDALHGSFLIFSKESIDKQVFNENMFLMCEEVWLIKYAKDNNIKFIYENNLLVNHKEDGAMGEINNKDEFKIWCNSYINCYRSLNDKC